MTQVFLTGPLAWPPLLEAVQVPRDDLLYVHEAATGHPLDLEPWLVGPVKAEVALVLATGERGGRPVRRHAKGKAMPGKNLPVAGNLDFLAGLGFGHRFRPLQSQKSKSMRRRRR